MLELAASGARVLALRSVEYARNHGVKIHVRSSFNDSEGTWIVKEEDMLEQAIISGIAHDTGEAKVTIRAVPDRPGVAGRTFRAARGRRDQHRHDRPEHVRRPGIADISFTAAGERARTGGADPREPFARRSAAAGVTSERDIAEDLGRRRRHEEPSRRRGAHLRDARGRGINIEIISTSSIRVSCVVPRGRAPSGP